VEGALEDSLVVSLPLGAMSDFRYDKEIIASTKYEYPSHGYEIEPIDVEEDGR